MTQLASPARPKRSSGDASTPDAPERHRIADVSDGKRGEVPTYVPEFRSAAPMIAWLLPVRVVATIRIGPALADRASSNAEPVRRGERLRAGTNFEVQARRAIGISDGSETRPEG